MTLINNSEQGVAEFKAPCIFRGHDCFLYVEYLGDQGRRKNDWKVAKFYECVGKVQK